VTVEELASELLDAMAEGHADDVVVCMDEQGGWDNVSHLKKDGSVFAIVFGGGSPFSDER